MACVVAGCWGGEWLMGGHWPLPSTAGAVSYCTEAERTALRAGPGAHEFSLPPKGVLGGKVQGGYELPPKPGVLLEWPGYTPWQCRVWVGQRRGAVAL